MNKYKIKLIIIAVLGCICLLMVLSSYHIKASAVSKYRDVIREWNSDLAKLKMAPSPENIFLVQKEYEWLIDKEKNLKQLLAKRKVEYKDLTPLQFKEELLSTQIKLKQLADIQDCKLQGDLGFPEFSAGAIPQSKDVSLLTKQLRVIDELVNLLLKCKIGKIESITRLAGVYYSEGNLYQEITFRIGINCTLEDLLRVLQDIINLPYILVARDIKIDKVDENLISVEILVGAVEFV